VVHLDAVAEEADVHARGARRHDGDVDAVAHEVDAHPVHVARRGGYGVGWGLDERHPDIQPHFAAPVRASALAVDTGCGTFVTFGGRGPAPGGSVPTGMARWRVKIVVCVKQVPDLQSDRSMAGGRLVRGEDDVLNELYEYAVEAAVALAESLGGTVTAAPWARPTPTTPSGARSRWGGRRPPRRGRRPGGADVASPPACSPPR
jgi:hypothetical protein